MKAVELEKILENIPPNLADVHPVEIFKYLNSKFHDGISISDRNIIIAKYVLRNLPQQQRIKPWDLVEVDINNRYGVVPGVDLNYILPWIRLVHAQGDSDLVVTKVEINN
jgi:hypothetical protein